MFDPFKKKGGKNEENKKKGKAPGMSNIPQIK